MKNGDKKEAHDNPGYWKRVYLIVLIIFGITILLLYLFSLYTA